MRWNYYKNKINLLIIAAGEGKRIKDYIRAIPKALVTINNRVVVDSIIESIGIENINSISVCISDNFKGELLKKYINNHYSHWVPTQFIVQPEANGTIDAISRTIKEIPYTKNIFISWADYLINEKIPIRNKNTIYVSRNIWCGWKFYNGRKQTYGRGSGVSNVLGMWYIKKIPKDFVENLDKLFGYDFVNYLNEHPIKFEEYFLEELYDVGNITTLKRQIDKNSAYSEIIYKNDMIIKRYFEGAEDFYDLERMWYESVSNDILKFCPEIYNFDDQKREIAMEYIRGEEKKEPECFEEILNILHDNFHSHTVKSKASERYNLIERNYVSKPLIRMNRLSSVPYLGKPIIKINGEFCESPTAFLKINRRDIVLSLLPKQLCVIHGDPTLQNIIFANGKYTFIDPRGFARGRIYGDPLYDIAKIMYSVLCYEDINKGHFGLSVEDGEFSYYINNVTYGELFKSNLYEQIAKKHYDLTKLHKILAIICLRASGYLLKKNIEMGIVAFLHGTVLLNRWFQNDKN